MYNYTIAIENRETKKILYYPKELYYDRNELEW